jgi:hypothetical protein
MRAAAGELSSAAWELHLILGLWLPSRNSCQMIAVLWKLGASMRTGILALAAICSGCATIVEGTTQSITVDVSPQTGTCIVSRQGEQLGISTPEKRVVSISKSQHDLQFSCSAPGYQGKTETLSSNMAAATVASFFLLDLGIVDAASGAWKKYPERIAVILQPLPSPPAAAPRRDRASQPAR